MRLTKNKGLRLLGWLMVLTLITLSLVRLPGVSSPIPSSDKLLHFISYFILTYWFFHTHPRSTKLIIIGFVLLGGLLEFLQSLTGYRFMEWLDLIMNIAGVIFAYMLYFMLGCQLKFLMIHDHPN